MKRIKNLSKLMLAVMTMVVMAACGGSDDNKSSEYTSEDIVKLLTGKWTISGDIIVTADETGKKIEGNYTGTMEFTADQKVNRKFVANCSHNDFPTDYYGSDNAMLGALLSYLTDSKYTVAKKNGKNYISFRASSSKSYDFDIVSLDKTRMRLVLDDNKNIGVGDNYNDSHVYMTIISN